MRAYAHFKSFWRGFISWSSGQWTVVGVPEKAASDMIKNFISTIGNPMIFTPTVYLTPEILKYDGHTVIHIHVPPSAEVHSYKKVIYDRIDDADVKVSATSQIASMYIRKQNIYTEKNISLCFCSRSSS